MFNLRAVERDGTGDRQLTFGDVSYVEPDVHMSGMVDGEPDPHAIGRLEISGQWAAGGEHAPRRSHHPSDRPGADPFGESG